MACAVRARRPSERWIARGKEFRGGLALWFRTGDYSDPSRKLSLDGRRSGPGVSVVWRDFDQRRGLEKRSEGQLTTSHQLGKYMGCR
jgi:hypothetical protein